MASSEIRQRSVKVPAAGGMIGADLAIPANPRAVVVFAHGSGSSRFSPRNRKVASALQEAGSATLLMDLLTSEEEQVDLVTRRLRFDIPRLAARLTSAIDWLGEEGETGGLPVVTFGASTGAAAALIAAADRPERVRLVISRGGRPDLAGEALGRVEVPTLLIVGGHDPEVLQLNEQAARQITGPVQLEVVPGATHLFEEPGALEAVIDLAVAAVHRTFPGDS